MEGGGVETFTNSLWRTLPHFTSAKRICCSQSQIITRLGPKIPDKLARNIGKFNLKNLQSGQTMPEACAMITEQEATIPAYSKSVSVRLNMRPGQTLNSKLGFFQPSRTCLKLGLTLEATPLMEVSSRAVYVLFNNCMAQDIHVPKANHLGMVHQPGVPRL